MIEGNGLYEFSKDPYKYSVTFGEEWREKLERSTKYISCVWEMFYNLKNMTQSRFLKMLILPNTKF